MRAQQMQFHLHTLTKFWNIFLKSVISFTCITDKCGEVRGVESSCGGGLALSHNSNTVTFHVSISVEWRRQCFDWFWRSHITLQCFSFIMCNTYLAWINLELSVPPNASSDMLSSTLMALQRKHTMLYCWGVIWTIKSPWHSQYRKWLQPGQFGVQAMVRVREFLFSTPIQTSSWAPPVSCTMGTWALFQG